MAITRKTTGTENLRTYKDGFGTLEEPSKMVTKSVHLSSFGSYTTHPNSTELTDDIGNRSCLIHTIDVMNVSEVDDVLLTIYDHAWGRYGNTGHTRYDCSDGGSDDTKALYDVANRGDSVIISNGGLDGNPSVLVGDFLTFENDGKVGTGTDIQNQAIEIVRVDTLFGGLPNYVRRGVCGTEPQNFWDNALLMAGRNRFKCYVAQINKRHSHQRWVFPIPLLVEGGWRVRSQAAGTNADAGDSTSALIVDITYSVLEHTAQRDQSSMGAPWVDAIGEIQDANYRYLKCAWHGGDTASTYTEDQWLQSDVEIYGAMCTTASSNNYRGFKVKDGTGGSGSTKHQVWDRATNNDTDDDPANHSIPMWHPYPIFMKKGIRTVPGTGSNYSGGDPSAGWLTVMYRPLKSYNTTANDSMV